jgi:3-hydroxybutyryl-CoA dehydrogenase
VAELSIGVVGAGVMGSGIAQTIAQAGYSVVCSDLDDGVIEKARAGVSGGRYGLDRAVERGKISRDDADATLSRLSFTTDLEQVANSDLIVECVPERIDLKIRVFRDLDRLAKPGVILASNTSGFPIAAMAAATDRPSHVIGWHWASPPPIMRFAEIIVTRETDEAVRDTVCEIASRCGKNPVVVQDFPTSWGFVANRIYGAMAREAQQVVASGIATHDEVNQLMVDCFNWPVGPFAMVKGATEGWKE